MHFKVLNDTYPSNKFLNLKFNFENVPCHFCSYLSEDSTFIYFFFLCHLSSSLWRTLQDWLIEKDMVADGFTFTLQNIM